MRSPTSLSEEYIQDAFHSYLKSSLTQAKIERLLDPELLSSAESDLMISGPALCLYFAALRCTTNPPSVPLPRSNKGGANPNAQPPLDLSIENCPPQFISFLKVWGKSVPAIQSLTPEYQHDLARVICGLSPLQSPPEPSLHGIAADLRAVAIEISQRRSFQDRYAGDLQAALDAGGSGGEERNRKTSFVPPPSYEASSPAASPIPSPSFSTPSLPNPYDSAPGSGNAQTHTRTSSNPFLSPPHSPTRTHSRTSSASSNGMGPPSPSSVSSTSSAYLNTTPAISLIRETLYASLADVLSTPAVARSIIPLLNENPTRAYFASVSLAILAVSTIAINPHTGSVSGVMGHELTLAECPRDLKPFMMELAAIGREAREVAEEDDQRAIQCVSQGRPPPTPILDRTKQVLMGGVGSERDSVDETEGRRASVEGRAVQFANRINGLSLGMTRLRAFRERQDEVFKVLAGFATDAR